MLSVVVEGVLPAGGPDGVAEKQLRPLLKWFRDAFLCLATTVPDADDTLEPSR